MPQDNLDTIPQSYADYKGAAQTFKPTKFEYQKQFLDPKEAEQAQEFTLAAAQTVGPSYQKETSMPPEQHAASQSINLNTNTVLHTTQTRNPQTKEPKAPDVDLMKAELPKPTEIPKEEVDLPTKQGGIESMLPSGEDITVNPHPSDIAARDKYAGEFKGTKSWGEVVGTQQWPGTMIKVDDVFKRDDIAWFNYLKRQNPTWSGEYVRLDYDPKHKGKMAPFAVNPPEVFKQMQGGMLGNVPDANVAFYRSKTPSSVTDEQLKQFNIDIGNEPWQTHALLKDNNDLAKFVIQHPDLMPALRKEAQQFPSNYLASEAGRADIVQKAVQDTYGGDQQVPTSVLMAIQSFNHWNVFKDKYQSEQSNISAKIKTVGENALNAPELDEITALAAKKLNDPNSVTDEDRRRFAELTVNITNQVIGTGSKIMADLWVAYQANTQSFISASKQVAEDMQVLGTKEGQDGLALYLRQKKGQELSRIVPSFFPEVMKAKEAERTAEEEKRTAGAVKGAMLGAKDLLKSAYTGIVGGVDEAALGIVGFGSYLSALSNPTTALMASNIASRSRYYTAKLLSNGGRFQDTPFAQVALNEYGYKPFYMQAGEMVGNMAPALLMGQFSKAPELAYFMMGTYNSGYEEAKLGGANELQAQTIGGLKGGLLGLFMHTIQMPSDLAKATVGRMSTDELINTGFTKKGLTDYIMKFLPTEQGAKSVALLNVQNLAQQASDFVINSGSNRLFGTHLETNQLDINNIAHSVAMNTLIGGLITGVAKMMPEAKGARMELMRNFDENPALYVSALEEMRKNAVAAGDFKTLEALNKAKEFIATSWAKESKLPKGLSSEQRTAALSLWDEIAEQERIKRETDPIFHEPIDAKIDDLHKQLKEVVASPEKAGKMVEKETAPIQATLEETVLKRVEPLGKSEELEANSPEKGGISNQSNSTPLKERTSKMSKDEFQGRMLEFAMEGKDSAYEYRLDMNDMSQKDREAAVKDIMEGRPNTKRAKKLQAHIDRMYNDEVVSVNRGRGNQVQSHDIPFKDWFGERTPEETDKDFAELTPEQQALAEQDYETEQQLTDAYWKQHAETNGFAKEADNTKAQQDARTAEQQAKREEITKDLEKAPPEEKPYHEQRLKLVDRYGKDIHEMIDDLKKDGRLEVKCPPAAKKRFSLRNLFKRA